MTKTTIDQLVFTPFAIGGYFCVRGLLEDETRLKARLSPQLKRKRGRRNAGCLPILAFAQLVAFSLVPVDLRVLFGSVCAVFWNARLSMINSSRLDEAAERRFETPDEFAPPSEPLAEACRGCGRSSHVNWSLALGGVACAGCAIGSFRFCIGRCRRGFSRS